MKNLCNALGFYGDELRCRVGCNPHLEGICCLCVHCGVKKMAEYFYTIWHFTSRIYGTSFGRRRPKYTYECCVICMYQFFIFFGEYKLELLTWLLQWQTHKLTVICTESLVSKLYEKSWNFQKDNSRLWTFPDIEQNSLIRGKFKRGDIKFDKGEKFWHLLT
jgi:hypothetical protein